MAKLRVSPATTSSRFYSTDCSNRIDGNITHRPPAGRPHIEKHRTGRPHIEKHRIEKHHDERVNMLIKVLRSYLRPYKVPIAIVVLLQLVVHDRDALPADAERRHHRQGRRHRRHRLHHADRRRDARRHARPDRRVDHRRLLRSPHGDGGSAATSASAIFRRVQSFSAREVGRFGAPSLITRTTNDVQQVQMLALMTFTLMVAAPIMCVGGVILALRQDVPLSSLLLVIVPVLVDRGVADHPQDAAAVPFDAGAHRQDQPGLREQITGIRVIRAFVRDQPERERFGAANDELIDRRPRRRPPDVADVPDRHDRHQRVERRRAVVRRPPDRLGGRCRSAR